MAVGVVEWCHDYSRFPCCTATVRFVDRLQPAAFHIGSIAACACNSSAPSGVEIKWKHQGVVAVSRCPSRNRSAGYLTRFLSSTQCTAHLAV